MGSDGARSPFLSVRSETELHAQRPLVHRTHRGPAAGGVRRDGVGAVAAHRFHPAQRLRERGRQGRREFRAPAPDGDRQGVEPARGPRRRGRRRSADRAPAGHRRARRDHHRDRGHRPPRGRHHFSAVRHPRGPRRRRGIRRERYLPADRRPRAGRRLAERRVLPAAAVDRVHQYRRALPGHGHRRRPAGDGHVQPHRHQASWRTRGAAQRPRRRPGGRELSQRRRATGISS